MVPPAPDAIVAQERHTDAEPSAAFTPSVEWLLPIVETAIADFHGGAAGGGDTVSRFISKRVSHAIYAENAPPFEIGGRVQPRGAGFVEGELLEFNADGTGALIRWNNGDEIWKALRNLEVVAVAREAKPTLVTATGVSADPGGTETKPEQNLHEKGEG